MTSKQLDHKYTTPIDIEVDLAEDKVIITLPRVPLDTKSESGKMDVIATTNGWLKTQFLDPTSGTQMQVNLFVGTKA
jgi:hypothetical protein